MTISVRVLQRFAALLKEGQWQGGERGKLKREVKACSGDNYKQKVLFLGSIHQRGSESQWAYVTKYPVKRSPAEFDPKEQLDNNLCQKRAAYRRLGRLPGAGRTCGKQGYVPVRTFLDPELPGVPGPKASDNLA